MRHLLLTSQLITALAISTSLSGCLKARLEWNANVAAVPPSSSTPGFGQAAGGGLSKNNSQNLALFGTAGRMDSTKSASNASANLKLTPGTGAVIGATQ